MPLLITFLAHSNNEVLMKKTALLLLLLLPLPVQARQIVLDIPDQDIKIVEQIVVDSDKWIRAAWAGKVSKCKERIRRIEMELAEKENGSVPANLDAICQKYLARPGIKSAKEVEDELIKADLAISSGTKKTR